MCGVAGRREGTEMGRRGDLETELWFESPHHLSLLGLLKSGRVPLGQEYGSFSWPTDDDLTRPLAPSSLELKKLSEGVTYII